MKKIMSVSLILFFCWNNQLMCSEKLEITVKGDKHRGYYTVDCDVHIKFPSNVSHNYLELNVLPSVKNITMQFKKNTQHNKVILNVPSFKEGLNIKSTFARTSSQHNHVDIYSFEDWKSNNQDRGDGNRVEVYSPLWLLPKSSYFRALLLTSAVYGGVKLIGV
jgi:hypothetical protein